MQRLFQRNSMYKLEGDIQIDHACQGGEMPAIPGKSGCGARNKVPFIVAVQTQNERPIFTHIRYIAGFTKKAIRDYAKRCIAAGSRILSDGPGCWNGLAEAGLEHIRKVTGRRRPRDGELK